MKRSFDELIAGFPEKYETLMVPNPMTFDDLPGTGPEGGGIYVFSEGDSVMYVGRTKQGIRARLRGHYKAADAPLAWLIAREETGRYATYRKGESRKALLKEESFRAAFDHARERVQKMGIRFIEEPEPWKQALFEIYVAAESGALYNDFDTH